MMFGVNGKPFIDLDNVLRDQINELIGMKKRIAIGIARVLAHKTGVDDYVNWSKFVFDGPFEGMTSYGKLVNFDPKPDPDIESMSVREREIFYKVHYGLYSPLNYIGITDIYNRWPLSDIDNDSVHFSYLQDWAKTLPFSEVAVMMLIVQDPGQKVLLHRDYSRDYTNKFLDDKDAIPFKDSIFFSPFADKRFFIYDDKTEQRHYVPCVASIWHYADWHGADAIESTAWTIKITGTFTEKFREEILCS